MTTLTLYESLLWAVFALTPVVFFVLRWMNAPYGRHRAGQSGGWKIPTRAAWILMEMPASVGFAVWFLMGPRAMSPLPLILFGLWELHYLHRTFLYPLTIRVRPGASEAAWVVFSGFIFNLVNGFLNATWLSSEAAGYTAAWLLDPRFIVGVVCFVAGFLVNRWADATLRGLRKPGETGYSIPTGGLYRWVSCPNYLGELVQWCGFALAAWSLPGLAFAVFTAANLVPRALANHRWYEKRFQDYPRNRRAIVPFVF